MGIKNFQQKKYVTEKPRNTDVFKVLGRAEYNEDYPLKTGKMHTYAVWRCECKICGRIVHKRTTQVKVMKSCGHGCKGLSVGKKKVIYKGKDLKEWSKITGISTGVLAQRFKRWGLCEEVVTTPLAEKRKTGVRNEKKQRRTRILAGNYSKTSEAAYRIVKKAFDGWNWVEIDDVLGMHQGYTAQVTSNWINGRGSIEQLTDILECSEDAELPYMVREKILYAHRKSTLGSYEFIECIFGIKGYGIQMINKRKLIQFWMVDKFCESYKVTPEFFIFCDFEEWKKFLDKKKN